MSEGDAHSSPSPSASPLLAPMMGTPPVVMGRMSMDRGKPSRATLGVARPAGLQQQQSNGSTMVASSPHTPTSTSGTAPPSPRTPGPLTLTHSASVESSASASPPPPLPVARHRNSFAGGSPSPALSPIPAARPARGSFSLTSPSAAAAAATAAATAATPVAAPAPADSAAAAAAGAAASVPATPSPAANANANVDTNANTDTPAASATDTTPSADTGAEVPAAAAAVDAVAATPSPSPTPAPVPAPAPVVEVTFIEEEIDPGKTDEERLKRYNFRRKVAAEILSTECSYVHSLSLLQDVYIAKLCDPVTGLLTPAQGATLFSNIPVIQPLQVQFLAELQRAVDGWTPANQEIGGLFLKFAPFFKMYAQYTTTYDAATSLLAKLDKSPPFVSMCRLLRASNQNLLDIQSYQIMPIQRIPRYKLLLTEMLRYTNPLHPDYAPLQRAQDLIADVALRINEAVRLQQNSQALLTLQDKFNDAITLIGPNGNGVPGPRRLLKQGPLLKKGRRSDARYEFLLFTDFLLYARQAGFGSGAQVRFKLHRKIFVNEFFSFNDRADGDATQGGGASGGGSGGAAAGEQQAPDGERNQIQILSAQKSFVVVARDQRDKADWMAALAECVAEFKRSSETVGSSGIVLQTPANSGAATTNNAAVAFAGSGTAGGAGLAANPFMQANAQAAGGGSGLLSPPTPGTLPRRGSVPTVSLQSPGRSNDASLASTSAAAFLSPSNVAGSEFGSQQPCFVQFKPNSTCSICTTKCTFSSGRHHCRACGNIVCGNCARDRVYLTWTKQRSRTCDRCCQRMKDERSAKLEKLARLTFTTSTPSTPATPAPTAPLPAVGSSSPSPAVGLLSPSAGGTRPALPITPRPPRPVVPSRPAQEQLIQLLGELLETTPRMEPSACLAAIGSASEAAKQRLSTRAQSVFIAPSPRASGSSSGAGAAAAPLPAELSAALPIAKFDEGASAAPKLVGKLPFVAARRAPLGSGLAPKQRSHSVLVTSASSPQSGSLSAGSLALGGGGKDEWENDGLSDSDDESQWDPASTTSTSSSLWSAPGRPAGLSFSERVLEEEDEEGEAAPKARISAPRPSPTSAVAAALATAAATSTSASSSSPSMRSSSLSVSSSSPPPPLPLPSVRYWCMARVLHAFTAADATQLTMAPGDVLLVTDKSHDDWWKGEICEPVAAAAAGGSEPRRGLFPSAFVFELRDRDAASESIFEAQGDYRPASGSGSEGHLSLSKGDLVYARQKHANGWWQVQHGVTRLVGWAPSNFLKPESRFPPLSKEQEDRLVHILARSALPTAPSPQTNAASSPPAPAVSRSGGGGGLLSTLKLRLEKSMTMGGRGSPTSARSFSVMSPPSPSPMGAAPSPGSARVPPALPARTSGSAGGRSQSVVASSSSPPPPAPSALALEAAASVPPERAEERKSIIKKLKTWLTARPSKEELKKKKILKE